MHGVDILALIDMSEDQILTHYWYADDNSVTGRPESRQFAPDKLIEFTLYLVIM